MRFVMVELQGWLLEWVILGGKSSKKTFRMAGLPLIWKTLGNEMLIKFVVTVNHC